MPPAATLPAPTATATLAEAAPDPTHFESEDNFIKGLVKQMGDDAAVTAPKPAAATPVTATTSPAAPAAATDTKPADPAKPLVDAADILNPKPGSKEYNWDALKKQAAEHKAAREAAEAKLLEYEKKLSGLPSDAATQLAAIQKERDDLSTRLEQADIERHPKFQAYFNGGFTRIKENIAAILPGENGTRLAELVAANALSTHAAEVKEIFSVLDPMEQSQLGALLIQGRNLHHEKQTEISRAGERRKQIQSQEEAERKASTEKLTKEFEGKLLTLADKDPLLQKREGDEHKEWNAEVDQRLASARSILVGDLSPEAAVDAALWASTGPVYRNLLHDQMAITAQLREQVRQLTGASPGGSSGGVTAPASGAPKKPQTEQEFVASLVAQMANSK